MNVQKVELFNGGGNCKYALIWELDKFIVVGDDLVTIWRSEADFFAATNGEGDNVPLEILEYNQQRIGE
jgi:hypothetical protein